jgi:hypothetical protein
MMKSVFTIITLILTASIASAADSTEPAPWGHSYHGRAEEVTFDFVFGSETDSTVSVFMSQQSKDRVPVSEGSDQTKNIVRTCRFEIKARVYGSPFLAGGFVFEAVDVINNPADKEDCDKLEPLNTKSANDELFKEGIFVPTYRFLMMGRFSHGGFEVEQRGFFVEVK